MFWIHATAYFYLISHPYLDVLGWCVSSHRYFLILHLFLFNKQACMLYESYELQFLHLLLDYSEITVCNWLSGKSILYLILNINWNIPLIQDIPRFNIWTPSWRWMLPCHWKLTICNVILYGFYLHSLLRKIQTVKNNI